MAVNKAHAQSEGRMEVSFLLQISGGTVSIANVWPPSAADDISVSDGGAGLSTITIKNFKGNQGGYNIQLTPKVTSTMSAVVSDSYTGDDLAFTVSTENDGSTLTDNVPVFVKAEAY
jgi:hypothetical protein